MFKFMTPSPVLRENRMRKKLGSSVVSGSKLGGCSGQKERGGRRVREKGRREEEELYESINAHVHVACHNELRAKIAPCNVLEWP